MLNSFYIMNIFFKSYKNFFTPSMRPLRIREPPSPAGNTGVLPPALIERELCAYDGIINLAWLGVHFYARQHNASRVLAIVWASVRLSVCPSVTLVICIKTVQARITKSLLWVSSLSWQNFVPLGAGVPFERGRQREVPPKKTSFCRYWLE